MNGIGPGHVQTLAGCSYRQIDYWCRLGMLSDGTPGSGRPRNYSARDVAHAATFARLAAMGAEVTVMECVLRLGDVFFDLLERDDLHYLFVLVPDEGHSCIMIEPPQESCYMLAVDAIRTAYRSARQIEAKSKQLV